MEHTINYSLDSCFRYALSGGALDWLTGGMERKEALRIIFEQHSDWSEIKNIENIDNIDTIREYTDQCDKTLESLENQAIDMTKHLSGEKVTTTRFFVIPNFALLSMEFCALTKTTSGHIYVFSNNSKFLQSISCGKSNIVNLKTSFQETLFLK